MPADRVIQSDAEVRQVAFSANGNVLAGACADGKVRIWDPQSGALKQTVPGETGDAGITLPGAGVAAAAQKDGTLRILDLETGEVSRRRAGSAPRVRDMAISADRKFVATSSRTSSTGSETTVRMWDVSGKELFAVPAGLGGTSAIAISPDGGMLVASSYDTNARVWSARNGELLKLIEELPVALFAMAFSTDGKYLAAAGVDRTVYLWEPKTWKLIRKLTGQQEMISSLGISPDGSRLATGGFSELTSKNAVSILFWDVATGKMLRSVPSPQMVGSVAFSPDGTLLASANGLKNVNIWASPSARQN